MHPSAVCPGLAASVRGGGAGKAGTCGFLGACSGGGGLKKRSDESTNDVSPPTNQQDWLLILGAVLIVGVIGFLGGLILTRGRLLTGISGFLSSVSQSQTQTETSETQDNVSKGLPRPSPYGLLVILLGFAVVRFADWSKRFKHKGYTREEVGRHNTSSSLWLIVNGDVYDVTDFLPKHPPGAEKILRHGGKDATFHYNYHQDSTKFFWKQLKIGWIVEEE